MIEIPVKMEDIRNRRYKINPNYYKNKNKAIKDKRRYNRV